MHNLSDIHWFVFTLRWDDLRPCMAADFMGSPKQPVCKAVCMKYKVVHNRPWNACMAHPNLCAMEMARVQSDNDKITSQLLNSVSQDLRADWLNRVVAEMAGSGWWHEPGPVQEYLQQRSHTLHINHSVFGENVCREQHTNHIQLHTSVLDIISRSDVCQRLVFLLLHTGAGEMLLWSVSIITRLHVEP